MTIANDLATKGFVLYRNFFDDAEISIMEKEILSKEHLCNKVNLGKVLPNAEEQLEDCQKILTSQKVKEKLAFIDDLYLTSITQAHINAFSNWHTDAGEAYGYYADVNSPEYHVYKMIFFTTKTDKSNCFAVVEGSHLNKNKQGKEILLETNPGDIVIFDTRLKHRGEIASPIFKLVYYLSKLLNYKPQISIDNNFISKLTKFLRIILKRPNRISLQFVFGKNNNLIKEYEKRAKEVEKANLAIS
tara:strand:+ start:50 stop:784 length:735 start_codon:yes stop_codon:yes gene_type:complete